MVHSRESLQRPPQQACLLSITFLKIPISPRSPFRFSIACLVHISNETLDQGPMAHSWSTLGQHPTKAWRKDDDI